MLLISCFMNQALRLNRYENLNLPEEQNFRPWRPTNVAGQCDSHRP